MHASVIFINYGEFKAILRFRMVFTKYNLRVFELCLLFSSHLKMELNLEKKQTNKQGQDPLHSG